MTSSTVTMPSTCRSSSTTGTASRLYLEMTRATSSRSVRGETVDRRAPVARVVHVQSGIGHHQLAQRDDAAQPLLARR